MTEKLDTQIRRDQISEAALDLISTQGLESLSMAALARRVGLVPSALYRHFQGKEQILDAVIDLIGERLLENADHVAGRADGLEALRQLLERHVALIRQNRGIPRLVFSGEIQAGDPRRRARLYRVIEGYLERVAGLVRQAQDQGQVRPEVDPEAAAFAFLGTLQPAALLWHLSDGKFDVTRQARRAWTLYREALETGPEVPGATGGRPRSDS